MIIEECKLLFHMKHRGPYLTYFNGKCDGFNKELVAYMNKMALTFPKLKIFEINLSQQKIFVSSISDNDINKVSIYFQGIKKEEQICLDYDKLNDTFKKMINYYNKNIESKAINIGTKPIIKNIQNKISIDEIQNKKQLQIIRKKQRYLLKQRIDFMNNDNLINETNNILSYSMKGKYTKPKKEIKNKKSVTIPKNSNNKIIRKTHPISGNDWFTDVKLTNLPHDIFDDNHDLNTTKNDQNLIEDKKRKLESLMNRTKQQHIYLNADESLNITPSSELNQEEKQKKQNIFKK